MRQEITWEQKRQKPH